MTTIPHGGGPKQEAPLLIRAGESVLFSVYAMHRRKDLYGPDAHEFRPERWDPNAKEYNLNSIGWAYLPFNGGPRTCLGQEFAIQEISYAIVKILQAVPNVELPEGTVREPLGWEKHRLTLVLQPAHGCVVKLSR